MLNLTYRAVQIAPLFYVLSSVCFLNSITNFVICNFVRSLLDKMKYITERRMANFSRYSQVYFRIGAIIRVLRNHDEGAFCLETRWKHQSEDERTKSPTMSINEMETAGPVAGRLTRKSHRTARKKAHDPRDRKRERVTACRGGRRIRERDGTT